MRKRLFRRSRWRSAMRAMRNPDFRVVIVLLVASLMMGFGWRFGVQGSGLPEELPPPDAVPTRHPSSPAVLATGPGEIREQMERLVEIGRPVRCGAGRQLLVALTFDDGPSPRTGEILGILGQHGARATFFMVGNRVDLFGAATVASLSPLHALGNHTWSHASLRSLPRHLRRREIRQAQEVLEQASGGPVQMLRPPYGTRDEALDKLVAGLGLVQVGWSQTVGDNQRTTARKIVAKVREELQPGSIVLLHEKPETVRALPRILEIIASRGYRTVTVPELLALDPPSKRQVRRGYCAAGSPADAISSEEGGGRP